MYFKIARSIKLIVILLMSVDILGASMAILPSTSDNRLTIHSEKKHSTICGSFLFEQSDEENETDDKNDHIARVVLIDFSWIARSFNSYHFPDLNSSVRVFLNYVRPPLHQLNCVFQR